MVPGCTCRSAHTYKLYITCISLLSVITVSYSCLHRVQHDVAAAIWAHDAWMRKWRKPPAYGRPLQYRFLLSQPNLVACSCAPSHTLDYLHLPESLSPYRTHRAPYVSRVRATHAQPDLCSQPEESPMVAVTVADMLSSSTTDITDRISVSCMQSHKHRRNTRTGLHLRGWPFLGLRSERQVSTRTK